MTFILNRINITDTNEVLKKLPKIDSKANFWLIRTESGKYFKSFINQNYIGLGFDKISLKSIYKLNKDKLKVYLHQEYKSKNDKPISKRTYTTWSGELRRFVLNIKINDYILIPGKNSKKFALGIVIGKPYEIQKKSNNDDLTKRIPVKFLASFNRVQADPVLYKMIYSQHTITKINNYAKYILRAAFDAYISNNHVYLTFHITQKANINAYSFTSFENSFMKLCKQNKLEKNAVIRTNFQSAGIVQYILSNARGIGLIITVLISEYELLKDPSIDISICGFHIKKGNKALDHQKVLKEKQEISSMKSDKRRKDTAARLNNISKSIKIWREAGEPMKKIQCKIPSNLSNMINDNNNKSKTNNN